MTASREGRRDPVPPPGQPLGRRDPAPPPGRPLGRRDPAPPPGQPLGRRDPAPPPGRSPGRPPNRGRADLELARRVASGDEAALGELLQAYRAPLRAFIACRLRGGPERAGQEGASPAAGAPVQPGACGADVDEVEQETLLAALETIGGFRGRSALFTWLCGIARHKVGDLLRRRGREPVPVPLLPGGGPLARLVDGAPLPEAVVVQRATRALVVEALWSLPEAYRGALLARYVKQEPVLALAARLGRTYKATESLLARAREAFKRRLLEVERLEMEQGERRPGIREGGEGDAPTGSAHHSR